MALRDKIRWPPPFGTDPQREGASPKSGNGGPPGLDEKSPLDTIIGHTEPYPSAEQEPMPRAGTIPRGQSGRANFWGLPSPDEINPALIGPAGLRRYDDMYRTDAHVRRLVLAAWSPIVAGTWTLDPYGGDEATDLDRQIAEDIWWGLTEYMSPNFTEHLVQVGPLLLRSGFLHCEQLWGTVKRDSKTLLMPRKLDPRLPKSIWRWWQDDFGELTYIGQILPNRADVIIPATDLVSYRLGAEGDNWQGVSLLRHSYKHWYLKDKLERIDAVGQERKAVGVPICYPPKGASAQQKAAVELLLANLHMSEVAYLMMPGPKAGSQGANGVPQDEWLIDVIQFDSSSGEGIMNSIAYHQTAISASFLTDFLELGHHQVGARATAEVQEDPFLTAINGALLPPILPPLNALIDRIRRVNWSGANGSPTLKLTLHDEASLSEIAAYVVPLIQAGAIQVDPELEDYLRNRGTLPAANAELRAEREQAATQPPPPGPPAGPGEQAPKPVEPNPNPGIGAVEDTGKPSDVGKALDQPAPMSGGTTSADGLQMVPETGGQRKRVCVDFDGVIHPKGENNASVLEATPVPGAAAGLIRLAKKYEVAICTARTDLEPVRAYLRAHAMGQFAASVTNVKPPAVAYVDDRAVPFNSWAGVEKAVAKQLDAVSPVAGGLAVHAADTGRVLVAKRCADDTDASDVFGSWEFPGGKLDPGDDSDRDGAVREWQEETGETLPEDAQQLGDFVSPDGAYHLHVMRIPQETDLGLASRDPGEVAALSWQNPKDLTRESVSGRVQQLLPGLHGILERKQLDAPTPAAAPTVKWWERLLSQDQLRQAMDGARDHIQGAVGPAALTAARKLANQAAGGARLNSTEPPQELVDALTQHYGQMYQLGHATVGAELHRQRKALRRKLAASDDTAAVAAASSRLPRVKARAEQSASAIWSTVQQRLGRAQVADTQDAAGLQDLATTTAQGQLRMEALTNTAALINDGRYDAAQAAPDVVGGIYTSCLDDRSCDPCSEADTGEVLSPDDAAALGPPNPDCEGGDYCRCTIVWVTDTDPAALGLA